MKYTSVFKLNTSISQRWTAYIKAKKEYEKSQSELFDAIATELVGSGNNSKNVESILTEYKVNKY